MKIVIPALARRAPLLFVSACLALGLSACSQPGKSSGITGQVVADGSSTVFPITEAVAEEFLLVENKIQVTVGIAGTGGGFSRFCNGETSVQDASRPISQKEIDLCAARGIEWIELPVAYDAMAIVVHPKNTWIDCITTAELNKIWETAAQGTINKWNQIRPEFPNENFSLYGAGTDSGTFDYFTEVINGKTGESRGDYTASEDDNTLVQGVSAARYSLGYLGLAYYEQSIDKLKALKVDGGKGCVLPSAAAVEDGTYTPLSRPLLIYVRRDHADRPEVRAFIDFYLENAGFLAADVGYVKLQPDLYELVTARWRTRTTGTIFHAGEHGIPLEQLLATD
ncbi:MAG: PstS family phosphate ABC transporter substrate-binding protein [Dehalococcoidia bacterium]